MSKVAPYAKAVVGALVAFLGTLGAVMGDGVTGQEWITVALTTLASLGFVYYTPNKPKPAP